MKVVLSLDPIKYPLTGIGRYTYELAKSLSNNRYIDKIHYLRGFKLIENIPEASQKPWKFSGFRILLQNKRIVVELYRTIAPRIKAMTVHGLKNFVYHGPNFYLPPFNGKSAVTVHDLSLYSWPECHPAWRVRYMKSEMKLARKRADVIITDSDFIKNEINSQFDFPKSRIFAIPLAGGKQFRPYNYNDLSAPLANYGLSPGGYCLFTGTIEPRKNIDTLLDAYQLMPATIKKTWPLILTGYEGWNSDRIHQRIRVATKEGWAKYLGYVPSEHLPKLFAGARLFVFPSLYEGFGLPVLEAMASGVPVVCSNSSSLPEVVGEAGAMCDPLDTDALAGLIMNGLENEEWRNEAIQKGLKRAKIFSWERCANETIEAYKAALEA